MPQLIENYQQGHADGISLIFLFIWAVGDVTNLAGALWAGLVPTVTALAVYFCFADTVLILQCLYYRHLKQSRSASSGEIPANSSVQAERTPLLTNEAPKSTTEARQRRLTDVTDENMGLPGSRRRSSALRRTSTNEVPPSMHVAPQSSKRGAILKNAVSIVLVVAAGAAGWAIAWKTGAWRPSRVSGEDGAGEATPIGAEILGYASAVCYLGARIPQIIKNQKERSCDGLSLLFFLLSLLGNASYGAGILFHSLQRDYIMTNLPWLIGSLGTMVEDAIIFVQFSAFGEKVEEDDEPAVV